MYMYMPQAHGTSRSVSICPIFSVRLCKLIQVPSSPLPPGTRHHALSVRPPKQREAGALFQRLVHCRLHRMQLLLARRGLEAPPCRARSAAMLRRRAAGGDDVWLDHDKDGGQLCQGALHQVSGCGWSLLARLVS